MRLYDVKYKGGRIIYGESRNHLRDITISSCYPELGLQEAIAHYAGNDPVQSGTAYLGMLHFLRRSEVPDGQIHITDLAHIVSIRSRGMISHHRGTVCRRLGMLKSCPRYVDLYNERWRRN